MTATIISNFITDSEAEVLGKWALQQREDGILKANIVPQRTFGRWRDLTDIPELFFDLRGRIASSLGIQDIEEPKFTSYVSVITSGGAVHPHKDADPPGGRHLRFNVLVSKPETGGMPIIEGRRFDVGEGDAWWFFPGSYLHTCETVAGDKPRIICSYGFVVSE